jgi:hypothetical protein
LSGKRTSSPPNFSCRLQSYVGDSVAGRDSMRSPLTSAFLTTRCTGALPRLVRVACTGLEHDRRAPAAGALDVQLVAADIDHLRLDGRRRRRGWWRGWWRRRPWVRVVRLALVADANMGIPTWPRRSRRFSTAGTTNPAVIAGGGVAVAAHRALDARVASAPGCCSSAGHRSGCSHTSNRGRRRSLRRGRRSRAAYKERRSCPSLPRRLSDARSQPCKQPTL